MTKTNGQIAYEDDLELRPNYEDGTARPTWEQLGQMYQKTAPAILEQWESNPRKAQQ